jgi:hypothetical protein
MSRAFWFVAGAASGVYTLVKAKRTARNFTPDGIGAKVAAVGVGARMFADEVAAGMSAREAELRSQLRLSPDSRPAIAVSSSRGEEIGAAADTRASTRARPGRQAASTTPAPPQHPHDPEGSDDGYR